MPCKLGHPATPCPYGNTLQKATRAFCHGCKEYEPPPHITQHCQLWDRDRVLCMKPKAACASCHECVKRGPGAPVREPSKTPEQRKADAAAYRAANRDRIRDNQKKFKAAHPNYFKNYMRKRRGTK